MSEDSHNRRKVLVVGAIHRSGLDKLEARDDVTVEVIAQDDPALARKASDAAAIIVRTAQISAAVIDAAPNLEVVARHGVGYDNVDVDALSRRGIPLTVVGTANAASVAEHALYMMLAAAKDGAAYHRHTAQGDWDYRDRVSGRDLYGAGVLVIGFGRIGSRVTALCKAFGMTVYVADPYIDKAEIRAAGAQPVKDFRAVLAEVNYVTVHAPLTEKTRHMIGAGELKSMRRSAVLINTARGPVIDEAALLEALKGGQIAAAGLDVFTVEPPDPKHPLFALENVILSPHVAGVTADSVARMSLACAENVLGRFDGTLDPDRVVNGEVLAAG